MVASEERASLVERIRSLRLKYLKVRAMLSIERDRIDSIQWHIHFTEEFRQQSKNSLTDVWKKLVLLREASAGPPQPMLSSGDQSQNGSDGDNGNGGNGDGENGNG
ncbi:hypothetical protein Tco_0138767 [Tanacetum coccineum]